MGKQKRDGASKTDLATLSSLTDDSLCQCLRARYETYQVYTRLGANQLVALNPGKPLALNDDQTGLEYVASYKDTDVQQRVAQPPHVFDLANRAYFYMRRTGLDQAVVLSGESGSGKTQIRNLIIRHLVRLSSHKKETKVQSQLLNSTLLLDAFGSSSVPGNSTSSRFGYYAEVQFSERGRMVGAKTIHYILEKARLTQRNESNFAVFYQLVAGATPDERAALRLQDGAQYNYLPTSQSINLTAAAEEYSQLKTIMKSAGFRREHISRILQLLAAILHLGNLVFLDSTNTQDAAYVKNTEVLDLVADFLGVNPRALENVLVFKTTMIRKDVTTLILNAEQATLQRDELARTLYSLLFSWMVERLNSKLCADEQKFNSFIGVLDMPGPSRTKPDFYSFLVNIAAERVHGFVSEQLLYNETRQELYEHEGVSSRGVCALMAKKRDSDDYELMDAMTKYNGNNPSFSVTTVQNRRQFTIQHFHNKVTYEPTGFAESNRQDQVSVDFVSLFRGGDGVAPSWNTFLVELWENSMLATESHPRNQDAVISAQQKLARAPSRRKSQRKTKKDDAASDKTTSTAVGMLVTSLEDLMGSLEEANLWSVFCIRPNSNAMDQFDSRYVMSQIQAYGLSEIAQKTQVQYALSYTHEEFLNRYAVPLQSLGSRDGGLLPRAQMEIIAQQLGWTANDATVGSSRVFLADDAWRSLEDNLRVLEKDEQRRNKETTKPGLPLPVDELEEEAPSMARDVHGDPEESLLRTESMAGSDLHHGHADLAPPPVGRLYQQDDQRSFFSEDDMYYQENSSRYNDDSVFGSENYARDMMVRQPPPEAKTDLNETEEDESKQSSTRKHWLRFVWFCTWWIPSPFLIWCGRMKRKDVRIAWREKVTLCIIIFFLCAFVIWFLIFFGEIVCPHQAVYSANELQSSTEPDKSYVAIRGEVFNLGEFAPHHYPSSIVPVDTVMSYAGQDVTDLFPVQVSALCQGTTGEVSPYVSLNYQVNLTDDNARYHDFRYSSGNYRPDWYYQQMMMLRKNYKVGHLGYEPKAISDQAKGETTVGGIKTTRKWAYIDNYIYDLTQYDMGGRFTAAPPGETAPADVDLNFIDPSVVALFRQKSGQDITKDWENLALDPTIKRYQLVCLRNLFFVGMVDSRNSAKCQFSTNLLLIVTCLLCAVIVFKFLAAFRLGSSRVPEELDKFVITQVTCYTEDEESLRKTIDSLATLRYDDKRKLLVVICDGMIVGSGNDRPTPRIVLDILGVDPQVDPEPLSFQSVGDGQKQHNMGKIYSGLYETSGHVVPYMVVVKCGKPTERQKPGNRGKRDSQLILMEFLNRVHFDAPMNPLQLEMYHQMKNVIGVVPHLYEYVLMVDADTEVMPDGLSFLASSMAHDAKIIGVCGETTLANEKATWTTMIQVYEYFISHHMIKAFESLFSTVTCLPGCFTMYRIRSVDGKRALFCANEIIDDYHINKVDTLHKKNLLHLGEDRYLTTLLLKHFPMYKTKFVSSAQCKTNAPDLWSVLISQRRRWINSTVHNLGELVFLPRLCGFCCFSMRFVVMLDLISTVVMPAIVGYLGYLIYKLATLEDGTVPYLTIAVLGGTYGLQAILFIVKRRWEYVIWMIVGLLAIPVFWFYIPIYAFWHFDDFSWGNTRVVLGEKGKKLAVADEGEFDPKSIPTMTWSQYEKMLVADDYWSDGMSQGSGHSSSYRSRVHGSSVYNGGGGDSASVYNTPSMMMPHHNDTGSVLMPSSASIPMMAPYAAPPAPFNMQMARSSMASFGQEQWQQQDQRQTSRPSMMMQPSGSAYMLSGSVHGGSQQSLLLEDLSQPQGPSNEELAAEVKRILAAADLTKVTKKQVREELQQIFGVPMNSRKDFINACINDALQERM
ncbi:chitin synthase-domain-containing protein [Dichotomocladium elegans]|nr:chitin synthase-domain-containing protein [Dichotomocladium elegans]